jgi:hypothetical protein
VPQLSRGAEEAIALAGAMVLLASIALMLSGTSARTDLVWAARIAGSIGAAMISFVLPRAARLPKGFRAIVAVAGAMLFYLLAG